MFAFDIISSVKLMIKILVRRKLRSHTEKVQAKLVMAVVALVKSSLILINQIFLLVGKNGSFLLAAANFARQAGSMLTDYLQINLFGRKEKVKEYHEKISVCLIENTYTHLFELE